MTTQIIECLYDDKVIEFDLSAANMMVNATEMAKAFGEKPSNYLVTDRAKGIIQACLSFQISGNSEAGNPFNGVNSEENLVRVNYRHGTWMHRIVALDFAAWLNPNFAVWMYVTVDQLLMGTVRDRLKRKAFVDAKIARIKNKIYEANRSDMEDLAKLELESKALSRQNTQETRDHYKLFRDEFKNSDN
ncbi:KilA domain-containing protein [Larkinella arboricola]|uniref:KilA domain-containing protein n=1 Tax=Larkinella arboricola TaxID=643671 RepID=A0A327WKA0_LARAB|nr:KilA-N domain-containing protein [Larkinella arboricola]RAJ92203.1 KilA domain-containing protein [Larkinella arboricola]